MSDNNEFELLPDQPSKNTERPRRQNMDDFADWSDDNPASKSNGSGAVIVGLAIGALVIFAIFGGAIAFLFLARGEIKMEAEKARRSRPVNAKRGEIGAFTLSGPDGQVQFPPGEVTVVNVFLQACADCMPSFNKYRDCGGFEDVAPVVNVAYNFGTKDWLRDYNMDTNLVLDQGGRMIVNPQGIRKFTTLVIDSKGKIHLRIQPTQSKYRHKVREKIKQLKSQ